MSCKLCYDCCRSHILQPKKPHSWRAFANAGECRRPKRTRPNLGQPESPEGLPELLSSPTIRIASGRQWCSMLCSGGSSQGSSTCYSAAASSPEQLRRRPPATMCGCRSRTRPGAPAVMTGLLVLAALLAAAAAPAADCRLLADSSQDRGTGSKLWQRANGARTSPSAPKSCICALPTCALVPHVISPTAAIAVLHFLKQPAHWQLVGRQELPASWH